MDHYFDTAGTRPTDTKTQKAVAMSQNNTTTSTFPSKGNAYETLALPNFATPSQIKKQFRQQSLKFHPDKREPNLTKTQHDELDKQFIAVQEARDFLLNDDHKDQKDKYDAKLKSEGLRKEEEKRREEAMGSRRRRMRDDLESKIDNLRKENDTSGGGRGRGSSKKDDYEDLKQDGWRRREEFVSSRQSAEERFAAQARRKRRGELENRQVRVKWSRKKMGGQSDEMLVKLLSSRFGPVDGVELIGSKGNGALVTFRDEASCKPCVDFYSNSEEMRASYVGNRKGDDDAGAGCDIPMEETMKRGTDRESVEERKLRQAAEREVLLRKMEMGGDENDGPHTESDANAKAKASSSATSAKREPSKMSMFPPQFPPCDNNEQGKVPSCLEILQQLEKELFKGLLSPEQIHEMQVPTC